MKTLQIAAVALAALVTSTTLAAAFPLNPHVIIPITPVSNNTPYIPINPGVIDLDPPAKPHIPIIPGVIDLLNDPGKTDKPMLLVDCAVKDTMPTTNDMWIVNVGEAELPSGLKIQFSVPSTGDHGAFMLNRSIASGHKVKVADLLHDALSGAPCRVQIL